MSQIAISLSFIVETAAGISTLSGAYFPIRKFIKHRREKKEAEKRAILDEAKEYTQKVKASLESKIALLEAESKAAAEALRKDLEYARETYNSEMRFLGNKIEELRDEMRTQMSQVIQLVSKLIDKT